jgi:hypothetical protein
MKEETSADKKLLSPKGAIDFSKQLVTLRMLDSRTVF